MGSNEKFRQMEDEMSRFEAEISGDPIFATAPLLRPVIGANTYNQVQQRLQQQPINSVTTVIGVPLMPPNLSFPPLALPPFSSAPPPPPPPPALVPQQLRPRAVPVQQSLPTVMTTMQMPTMHVYMPSQQVYSAEPILAPKPAVVSSAPHLYHKITPGVKHKLPMELPKPNTVKKPFIDVNSINSDMNSKLKKLKNDKPMPPQPTNPIAEAAINQGKASSALQSFSHEDKPKKEKKNKKLIRTAGGQTWEDGSLQEWEDDDFRIFCGDLGNDVTDELLIRTFNKFPSFLKAKVVRDKRTNKSKGFGFVSFKDPADFIKAMKEMDGRYVGSRPIKLRKSTWKNRSLDVVRRKDKEKTALINMLTNNAR